MSDGLSTRLALHALDAYPNVDTAMVTDATLEASRRARRVSAFQSAVRLCDRALAVADRPEQRFDLLLEEGDAHHDAANLEDADRLYGAAWDLAVDNGQARRQGLSALRRARIWWVAFTPRPGHRERLEAAIVALGTDEPLLRAELEAHLASTMSDEDWQAARSLAYRAWSQANRTEDRAMTCELLVGARNGLFQTASPNELLAISTRIKRCSSGDHSEHFRDEAFNAMVCDLLRLGRFKEVQQEVEEQRQRVRETRRPWSAYLLESVESLLALWEGRWHDAGQHLAQMEAFLKGTDNALLGARGTVEQLVIAQKAWLAHERGATLALEEHTEVVATAMRRAGNAAVWQTGLALLALETGDYSQASSAVAAVVQNSGDPSAFPPHGWGVPTLFLLAEVCAALCQHEFKGRAMAGEIDLRVLARDVRRLLLPHRQEMGLAGWPAVMLGPIARAVGLAELAGGSPEGAIPLLEEAAQWTPLSPPLRARLSLDMAQAMLRTNRRDYEVMAKKYLEVSVREATRLGMSAVASRAGEMLQEIE